MRRLLALARRLFPVGTWRGRVIRALVPASLNPAGRHGFQHYLATVEPKLWQAPVGGEAVLFSVVIPMFNTPQAYLWPLIDSLINQVYPGFEAVLADASTDPERADAIRQISARDARLRYLRLPSNDGISANTNAALALASAPYVVFADHDDVLGRHALNEVAVRLLADPAIDIVYSDEDALTNDGLTRFRPSFKPSWSPHMFLQANYTNHLSVIRRSLVEEAGGLRPEFDGAQDWDLLLRLHSIGRPVKVCHVPAILYHWRESANSTARSIASKQYAVDAGRTALAEHLRRIGVDSAGVEDLPEQPSWHRIKPRWPARVGVVCAGQLTSVEAVRQATGSTIARPVWLSQPDGFDQSGLPDDLDAVVVFFRYYHPEDRAWLDDLVGALTLPQATVVAPLLVGHHGLIDSAGYVRDKLGVTCLLRGYAVEEPGLSWPPRMIRDVDAVSRAVVAVKRADLDLLAARPGMGANLVIVPPERGRAVVWGPQQMRRREVFQTDGDPTAWAAG